MNTYEIQVDGSADGTMTAIGETAGQAKYHLYLSTFSDCWNCSFGQFVKHIISCRKLRSFSPWDLFSDPERFNRIKEARGIDFAYQGMKVEVLGRIGYIVGGNDSMNLDIVFTGECWPSNCHPHYEIKYFDSRGNIVADYCGKGAR